jgi:hypothetical protein
MPGDAMAADEEIKEVIGVHRRLKFVFSILPGSSRLHGNQRNCCAERR